MKKLLITLLITSLISFLFGNYIFKVYIKNVKEIVKEASSIYDDVYMLLYGSYNTIEKAKKNNLNNYILKEEYGFYKVYIGVTKSKENAEIIREIYKEKGNDIYIKEKRISGLEFMDYLYNVDVDFKILTEGEILEIQNNIINKYKECSIDE